MKRFQKLLASPLVGLFAFVVIAAAISRAVTWHAFRVKENSPTWDRTKETIPRLILGELTRLFKFNSFS